LGEAKLSKSGAVTRIGVVAKELIPVTTILLANPVSRAKW